MKITICGSMNFSREMIEAKDTLEKMGHEVLMPYTVNDCLKNPELNMDLEYCLEKDVMRNHFDKIAQSDAILVCNYEKNGIEGYVGGSVLMEMAVAKYLNKKIFLLNPPPKIEDLRYSLEIQLSKPVILNGDLSKII